MRAMVIDRRALLLGGGAGLLAKGTGYPAPAPKTDCFAAAFEDDEGHHGVAVLDLDHGISAQLRLPARGHDLTWRPETREAIVFARRPGRFAMVFDIDGKRAPCRIDAEPERHFFGHGVYASGNRLLFSTENDVNGGRGVLGVRDATDGYRPIGVLATSGIGPHDVALLADGRTLVVANGGIDTDPDGRDVVSLAEMRPSLAYLDALTGDLLEVVELEEALRPLSIRHLAVCAGDVVAFGCQWEGERSAHPPLLGLHRRGAMPQLIAAPAHIHRRLRDYIGSVTVDAAGEIIAATSPKGGLAVLFDSLTGRYLGARELEDVCGVAPASHPGAMLLTSGNGALRLQQIPSGDAIAARDEPVHWDNHVVRLPSRAP
jgi:hypothetical protein